MPKLAIGEVSSRLSPAQHSISTQNFQDNRKEWQAAKQAFYSWADTLELTKRTHIDATLHKFSYKAGKLLARLCKGPHRLTHITSLWDISRTIKFLPQEVNKVMLQHYSTLPTP